MYAKYGEGGMKTVLWTIRKCMVGRLKMYSGGKDNLMETSIMRNGTVRTIAGR